MPVKAKKIPRNPPDFVGSSYIIYGQQSKDVHAQIQDTIEKSTLPPRVTPSGQSWGESQKRSHKCLSVMGGEIPAFFSPRDWDIPRQNGCCPVVRQRVEQGQNTAGENGPGRGQAGGPPVWGCTMSASLTSGVPSYHGDLGKRSLH